MVIMPPKVNEFVAKALEKQLKQLTSTLVNHRCAANTLGQLQLEKAKRVIE